jgi:23S rRNA pseudouridine2604 synthase
MKEIKVHTTSETRINTYLRDQGVGSRRQIDELISKNMISINGKQATLGSKVKTGDTIAVTAHATEYKYALYYKPRGEITGRLESLPGCEPVGRLDKESEGLLLYTNDFRVVDALLNPNNKREKEYEVVVREKMTPRVITLLKKGIKTQEATYAPVKSVAMYNEDRSLRIIITEGKKHEIRRMLNALNLTIQSLKRVRILNFTINGVAKGKVHVLTPRQITALLSELGIK